MGGFFRTPGTFVAACMLVCWTAVAPAAQPAGQGVVLDGSGAPIPGATVRITVAGQVVSEMATSADGTFTVAALPAGDVAITVSAPGFAPVARQLTTPIAPGALDVVLQAAGLAEAVTVTATRGVEQLAAVASASVLVHAARHRRRPDDRRCVAGHAGFSLFRRSSSRVAGNLRRCDAARRRRLRASRTLVQPTVPAGRRVRKLGVLEPDPGPVDRIEVVRGASGDIYAADALGGVIQVLTLPPTRTYLRALTEAGSRETWRASAFASAARRGWHASASGEWLDTDGAFVVAPEDRGSADVPAWSDYSALVATAGHDADTWRALARMNIYSEVRGNGTALVGNDTNAHQYAGEVSGAGGQQTWLVRGGGGTQRYFNNFSAVAAGRNSERQTSEQRVPLSSGSGTAQWTLTRGATVVLAGGELRRTDAEVRIRYSLGCLRVRSSPAAQNGRRAFVRRHHPHATSVVAGGAATSGVRHRAARRPAPTSLLRPARVVRGARALTVARHRAYRSPTLNELHRSFRVGNVFTEGNPLLQPERLTGGEAGALVSGRRYSARATFFFNHLDDVVTNVTVQSTPTLITRQKQNADNVRATGIEAEADVRPSSTLTLTGLAVWTDSTFRSSAAQPALAGNRVPQVPSYQFGAGVTWADPRWLTATLQVRAIGEQYDDDLNTFLLDGFTVADAYVGRPIGRRAGVFAVENLGDVVYDTGRTPVRTIGWPRTVRVGLRLQLP
jgi:outer membrane cobalamin receptor